MTAALLRRAPGTLDAPVTGLPASGTRTRRRDPRMPR